MNYKKGYTKRRNYKKKVYKGVKKGNKYAKLTARNTMIATGLTVQNKINKLYHFKRSDINFLDLLPLSGQTARGGIINFTLSGVPNYAEFCNLFQKYRFNKVKLTFRLIAGLGTASVQPTLYIAKNMEPTDTSTPTEGRMEEMQNLHIMQFSNENRLFEISCIPYVCARSGLFNGSTIVASDVIEFNDRKNRIWLDCNLATSNGGSGVTHFGFRYWLDYHAVVADNDFDIEVVAEYDMSFKGTD